RPFGRHRSANNRFSRFGALRRRPVRARSFAIGRERQRRGRVMPRSIVAAAALVLLRFSAASAQQPPDLSLREVYDLALEGNPMVRAAHAAAEATAARQPAAALPPDPELRIGAMNLSLPSLSADMPGAMAPSIELMQMLP